MQPPKIPSFFKNKKPNRFYYEPRYYNERKEKMEERYNRVSRELNPENSQRTDTDVFRSSLREQWGASNQRGNSSAVNKRVLFYIVLLVGLAYYFLR